jgi:FkbM family methyltransferase
MTWIAAQRIAPLIRKLLKTRAPRGQSPWDDTADLINRDLSTIFDVGANVGNVTVGLRNRFPSAEIYSFEPVAATYAILEANTAPLARVRRYRHGFSDHEFAQEIYVQRSSEWNSIAQNVDVGMGTAYIELKTIDTFCAQNNITHIDLVKTDTEGHDLAVVRGAMGMLSEGCIDVIYAEVGFHREDLGHTYFCELLEYMQKVDFQFFGLYELEGIRFVNHPCYPWFPYANGLFVRNDLVERKYRTPFSMWLSWLAEARSS